MGFSSAILVHNTDALIYKILKGQLLNESIRSGIRKLDLSLIASVFTELTEVKH